MAEQMVMSTFVNSAQLNQRGFYKVVEKACGGDLSKHPFATVIFIAFAGNSPTVDVGNATAAQVVFSTFAELVPAEGFDRAQFGLYIQSSSSGPLKARYETLRARMAALETAGVGDSGMPFATLLGEDGMASWRKQCRNVERTAVLQNVAGVGKVWERYQAHIDVDELFARYDVDDEGHLSHSNAVMMTAFVGTFMAAFAEFADEGSPTMPINRLVAAMRALKFGELPKMIPMPSLFLRFKDENGELEDIDCWEFVTGCARMMRPVAVRAQAMALPVWPGLPSLNGEDSPSKHKELAAYVDTLETGDMLVMSLVDDTARYFNFLSNQIWTHVGIVLRHKHDSRPGVPNLETEELMKEAKFRWRTHRFCTPRYCKCFVAEAVDHPVTELFEATGQGIHVYDLASRMFVGFNAARIGTLAVRRLRKAPGRENNRKIEGFIRQTRGHLYQVHNDDGLDSQFCSQLSTAFLRHMGWLSPDAKADFEYTPNDFASATVPLAGGAEWGEIELLRNQWTSTSLPLKIDQQKLKGSSRVGPSRL